MYIWKNRRWNTNGPLKNKNKKEIENSHFFHVFFSSSKNRSEQLPFFLVHFCCFFRFDVWAKEWFIYLFQLVLTTWCALHAIYSNLKPKYMRIHESIVTSLTLFSSAKFFLMCNLFFSLLCVVVVVAIIQRTHPILRENRIMFLLFSVSVFFLLWFSRLIDSYANPILDEYLASFEWFKIESIVQLFMTYFVSLLSSPSSSFK